MPQNTGPYLSYAVLCERVLRETDDVVSLIRIVDRLTVTAFIPVPTPPAFIPPAPLINITLAVSVKSGEYSGTVPIRVRLDPPSQFDWPAFETFVELRGKEQGATIVLPMQFPAQDEGIYWFAVEIAGELSTRVPLRIVRQVVEQSFQPHSS